MLRFLQKRWVYHSLIWLSIIAALTFLDWVEMSEQGSIWELLPEQLKLIPVIYIVYFNFTIKEKVFDKRRYGLYSLLLIFLIATGTGLLYLFEQLITGYPNSIQQTLLNVVSIIPASLGLQYFKRGIINQYQLQELKAKTLETELNVLKAQINPHFLFNTLNNIYGMNQINAEKGSEMIMELSDVMRYHLEFSKKEKISLENEIQLLDAYIKLEQLRLNDNCALRINLKEVNSALLISPLLLLPFVENAFKHGTHPTQPCFVSLKLKTNSNELIFELKNSIINHKNTVQTHIGLENTKKRLQLIYGPRQALKINKTASYFQVHLTITL